MAKRGKHSIPHARGHARRRLAALAGVAGAVVLAALLAVVLLVAPALQQREGQLPDGTAAPTGQQTHSAQEEAVREYAAIVGLVNQADETVVPLSKLVSKTLDDDVAARIQKVLAGKDAAAALLQEASTRLQALDTAALALAASGSAGADASADDPDTADATANPDALGRAISARADMLTYGAIVLNASATAYELSDDVTDLWRAFLDGHDELQKASEAVASGTTKSVKRAQRRDQKALASFQQAQELLDGIAKKAPDAELSAERAYVKAQIKAARAAAACDEALLDEDGKAAKKHNREYQQQAERAAAAAKKLPTTTDDLVESIYYSLGADGVSVQDAQNTYEAAATRAAEADRQLAAAREAAASAASAANAASDAAASAANATSEES